MKIRVMGAELFHACRRTEGHDEANSRFSQFYEGACRRPWIKNVKFYFWLGLKTF